MTKVCSKCYNIDKHKKFRIQKISKIGFCDECGKLSKNIIWTKAPWTKRKRITTAIIDMLFDPKGFLWRLNKGYYKDKSHFYK